MPTLTDRLAQVKDLLRGKKMILALSGGVASGTLAHIAKEAGADITAVTIHTPFTTLQNIEGAKKITEDLALPHRIIEMTNGTVVPELVAQNDEKRCYFCKKKILSRLETVASEEHAELIVDGTNLDDEHVGHNGFKALQEHPILSPWKQMKFTKGEIREVARMERLFFADKSFHKCLATRISDGLHITPERLNQIRQAEEMVMDILHVPFVRVTLHHNDLARITIPVGFETDFFDLAHRQEVVRRMQELGFQYITFDLCGFN